ncbi:hypothetical protein ACFOVU_24810 [Nocardiopsis sediminis]|uniref:Uncharacterized protein n=1 Tax=Nocardiopsis sediminis TaxID=1778267 RepID=A0ABV8FVQ3_9ACTN
MPWWIWAGAVLILAVGLFIIWRLVRLTEKPPTYFRDGLAGPDADPELKDRAQRTPLVEGYQVRYRRRPKRDRDGSARRKDAARAVKRSSYRRK